MSSIQLGCRTAVVAMAGLLLILAASAPRADAGAGAAASSAAGTQPSSLKPVPFMNHRGGYAVDPKFETDKATSFLVCNDYKSFDTAFDVALQADQSALLPSSAFKARLVVAAIYRTRSIVGFKVESVTASTTGKLIVRYTTTANGTSAKSNAFPLIVSVEKGDYTMVVFYDNDKPVARVEVPPPSTQPDTSPYRVPSKVITPGKPITP